MILLSLQLACKWNLSESVFPDLARDKLSHVHAVQNSLQHGNIMSYTHRVTMPGASKLLIDEVRWTRLREGVEDDEEDKREKK